MQTPGFEPGQVAWKATILARLDHICVGFRNFQLIYNRTVPAHCTHPPAPPGIRKIYMMFVNTSDTRAGRSAVDRLLCKQEVARSNRAQSILLIQTMISMNF